VAPIESDIREHAPADKRAAERKPGREGRAGIIVGMIENNKLGFIVRLMQRGSWFHQSPQMERTKVQIDSAR